MKLLESAKTLKKSDRLASGGSEVVVNRKEAFGFPRNCAHPSTAWVRYRGVDRRICSSCGAVLEEGWPDHHPEISRWLNEGGAIYPPNR